MLNSGFVQWVLVVVEWVTVGCCWGFGSRWVGVACRVACGGFLGGSRWVAVGGWILVDPAVLGGGLQGLFIVNKNKNNNKITNKNIIPN